MPTVLAIDPGIAPAVEGRSLVAEQLAVELRRDAGTALELAATQVYDLLVLGGMPVDEQQRVAALFQQHRRWRLVPILYLQAEGTPGLAIPAGYRPEMDSLARGDVTSAGVARRMRAMAREGMSEAELVVAGSFELDPVRGLLRLAGVEVALTERESGILGLLLAKPNRTVSAGAIIERGWGREADDRHLQILRRHISNIRRKLEDTPASRSLRTVRGSGYRIEVRAAS